MKKMKVVQLREGEQGRTEKERSGRVRTDSKDEVSGNAKRRRREERTDSSEEEVEELREEGGGRSKEESGTVMTSDMVATRTKRNRTDRREECDGDEEARKDGQKWRR